MERRMIDLHCDALSKLQLNRELQFFDDERLDVNVERMIQGGVGVQCFAIYLSEKLGKPQMSHILDQLDLYTSEIVAQGIMPISTAQELEQAEKQGRLGGLLSIEGADGLEGNLHYVKVCYERGVRLLGLTWNYANWAADGILEPRGGGLTPAGRELVRFCQRLGIILDVSHLSVKGFWELASMAEAAGTPLIASHSNAYKVCPHARNLQDDQISALISLDGRIGITFVPWFVKQTKTVERMDILPHLDHVCALGGEKHIMFGSDFDGIERHVKGLEHAGKYEEWADLLLKYYPEELVSGWLYGNAKVFLKRWLP
ncbi:dipeptidase [Paenibacillus apis]|uniref:Dipeptidase n=1 Tax=Paenibacillus apis TaxID=1792174 RepID=A0A920CLS8_9BACL|nr:dipeptidase [Paenibacillus apis]GIO41893.1 dipeptidase [Paenibacillus apis]